MAKSGRQSPGVGRAGIGDNSGMASYEAITKALAVEVIDQEEAAKLRELRKMHRKAAEGSRVDLSMLDILYRKRDDAISDIFAYIKGQMHYLGTIFTPLRAQVDLFMKASDSPEMQHAARHAGRMAGLKGEKGTPPPNLVGEDVQLWMQGYGDGSSARAEAQKERKRELSDILAQALQNAENGDVTDGTGKNGPGAPPVVDPATKGASGRNKQAEQVGDQAAKDFAKDNPAQGLGDNVAPPQPDWTGFDVDPKAWTDAQNKAFNRWFDLVPATAVVAFKSPEQDHIAAHFKVMRDLADGALAAGGEAPKKDDPALDGDGAAPEPTAGHAPPGEVYMLSADEPYPSGRQRTYRDGKDWSTAVPGKLPVYDTHPPADAFEASPEELAAQKPRAAARERQEAEMPDPASVEAGAAALKESGFAPAPKRKPRLPGEKT